MLITIYYSSMIGAFGLVLGSFFSVVIDRSLRGESIIFPRSHCVHCHHPIKFYDLIPLISYILLGGKCRFCKHKISLLNPIIECLTAASFILVFTNTSALPELLIGCGLFSLLIIVTVTDLQSMIIPNKVILSFSIYFLFINILYLNPQILEQHLLGCGFGLFCPIGVWLIYHDGIGWGDIKLFGLLGFVLGPHDIFTCMFLSCVIGILSFLSYLLVKRFRSKNGLSEHDITRHLIPFAPFISTGAIIAYLLG